MELRKNLTSKEGWQGCGQRQLWFLFHRQRWYQSRQAWHQHRRFQGWNHTWGGERLVSRHQCHWWQWHQEGTLYDRASISRSSFQSFQTRLWQPSALLLLHPSCILHCFQPSKVHIHATLSNTSLIFSFLINSFISSCTINNSLVHPGVSFPCFFLYSNAELKLW